MKDKLILPHIKVAIIVFSSILFLLFWDISSKITDQSIILPSVKETLTSLYKIISSGEFFSFIFTAFFRVFAGLFLGVSTGILLAALCHRFDVVSTVISPIISIMKATPVACIIVLLWIRFNYTEIAVLVVLLMVMPVVWQNVYDGLGATDKNMLEVASIFKLSKIQKIKVLYIPSVLSYLIPAVITSVGLAWKAEIAAEIMTYSNIGELIRDFKTVSFDTASIFAWTIIIVTFSILFEKSAKYLLGRLGNVLKAE